MSDTLEAPEQSEKEVKNDIFSAAIGMPTEEQAPESAQEQVREAESEPERVEPEEQLEAVETASEPKETPLAEDDDSFDLEAHTENKKEDPEPEQDLKPTDTSGIRAQLAKEGKARKVAEEELATKQEEILSLQKELETLKNDNKQLTASTQKVENHPAYQAQANKVGEGIASDLADQGLYNLVPADPQLYARWAQEALNIKNVPYGERKAARDNMELAIGKRLNLIEEDDEDFSVDPEAEAKAKAVFGVFNDWAKEYSVLLDTKTELQEKQGEMALELGYAEREAKAEPLRKRIAEIINLDDELIQDDPHSLLSQSATKLKEDTTLAKNIARTIEEYRFGPRVLSQDELDSLKRAGKDIEEHKKAIARKTQKNNDFIDNVLMQVLPDFQEIKETMKSKARAKAKKQDKKETENSIRELTQATPRKPEPPKEAPQEGAPSYKGMFADLIIDPR